jgi:predicted aspartyl protease
MQSNPYFDKDGRPTVDIEVSNPLGWKKRISALMDTGFDGFLSLPISEAFPIGLMLRGTVSVTLADGSKQLNLYCLGTLHFDGDHHDGVMIVEWSSDTALVGMEFLRSFNRRLIVDPANGTILLRKVVPPAES